MLAHMFAGVSVHMYNCTHFTRCNASKVMLKVLQPTLQQYMNQELPDVQAGFRKGRGPEDCQHSLDHKENKRISEEHLLLL